MYFCDIIVPGMRLLAVQDPPASELPGLALGGLPFSACGFCLALLSEPQSQEKHRCIDCGKEECVQKAHFRDLESKLC